MQYDLVFEGGGAKGMAFVGAMQAFTAAGHTYRRLIGSSAGAITALTLAAGYSPAEMLTSLSEQVGDQPVFATFLGEPSLPGAEWAASSSFAAFLRSLDVPGVPEWIEKRLDTVALNVLAGSARGRHLLSFMEYGGWFAADTFVAWLERKLNEGTYEGRPRDFGKMTFAELFERTRFDLTLTGSDITSNHLLVLNHRTAPHVPVVWGARMSMSLPLLWQEVIWREEWGPYRGRPAAGHVVVDGGLLSNFPIELLVSNEPEVTAVMGPRDDNPVLGFLIDEQIEVPGAPPAPQQAGIPAQIGELRTAQRLKGLLDTVTSARDKSVIATNERRVVRLPAKGYRTTEFDMTAARRQALVESGRATTQAFLARPGGGLEAAEDTAESNRIALNMLDMSDF